MALIEEFSPANKERVRVHEAVECGYTVFERGGSTYLQLDTYGTSERQIPGKTSQTIQLSRDGAVRLRRLLDKVFPDGPQG